MSNLYLADNSPFFPETIDRFLRFMQIAPDGMVLEVGCVLNRLMTHFQCSGIGIDFANALYAFRT